MRHFTAAVAFCALAGASHAGDLGIHVILSGQVAPGVYGQVQIGNAPPPPVVYAAPVLIEPQAEPPPPVYLHVPPGHARNWRKHCHAYNACNRPVYFVRSSEYSQDDQGHEHDRGHGEDRKDDDRWGERDGHGHGHGHDGHGDD